MKVTSLDVCREKQCAHECQSREAQGKGEMCEKRLGKRDICRSWLTCHDKTHIGLNLRLDLTLTSLQEVTGGARHRWHIL